MFKEDFVSIPRPGLKRNMNTQSEIYPLTFERMCSTLRLPAEPDVHQANPHGRPRVRADQEVNFCQSYQEDKPIYLREISK